MTFLTLEALTRDVKTVEVKVGGMIARIREMSRSVRMGYDEWLRPNGEIDSKRELSRDLKLCCLCLVDENDKLLMDYDDDQFDEFVETLKDKAAGPWAELALEVLRVNGYLVDDEEDVTTLLGKLELYSLAQKVFLLTGLLQNLELPIPENLPTS